MNHYQTGTYKYEQYEADADDGWLDQELMMLDAAESERVMAPIEADDGIGGPDDMDFGAPSMTRWMRDLEDRQLLE
jgi:hypothetical protein